MGGPLLMQMGKLVAGILAVCLCFVIVSKGPFLHVCVGALHYCRCHHNRQQCHQSWLADKQ